MPKWKIYAGLLLVTCFLIVSTWFGVSVYLECVSCAPRGGALGVVLSFSALFILSADRYHSIDVLDRTASGLFEKFYQDSNSDPAILAERNAASIEAIKSDLRYARGQSKWENICIAAASFYSTIFWGFGDVFAMWILG